MVPKGWEFSKLGNVAELQRGFDLPSTKRIDGNIPIVSSSGVSGYHNEYKVEKPGIVTGRYGSIGNVYYVEENFWPLNTSLWVKNFHSNYPKFIYYLLSSFDFKKFSDKTGVPGVNRNDLHAVKVAVPPLLEQKKIVKILSTWDKAISTTERLIENSTQQKKALMQQLLTGKKRLLDESGQQFSDKWKKVELGKLLDYEQPTPYLVKSTDYLDEYMTPVLTAGKTFILGYTDEEFGVFADKLPVIIFDDFTTASKFVDFPFKAKSSAMKMLTAKDGFSIKYIFEAMQFLNFAVGGHQRHWISIFSNLAISLPSIEEQQKIATVLTNADKEIELLEQQLADLQQEKKALMQVLLVGKKRVVV